MDTPSSGAVFLRAMVMLACVVAIPAAAVFGTALPEPAKQFLRQQWSVLQQQMGIAANSVAATEAPRFVPDAPRASLSVSSGQASGPLGMAAAPAGVAPGQPAPPQGWPGNPGAMVANGPATSPWNSGNAPTGVIPVNYETPADRRIEGPGPSSPAGALTPVEQTPGLFPPAGPSAAAPMTPLPQNPSAAGSLIDVQQRLRALGSTYSLLESWGAQTPVYRFYCKMAIGGNPNYTRYFEATDANPMQAMASVLQQVEVWRASHP